MRIVCAVRNCRYASDCEDSCRVAFINFPNNEASRVWARRCGREDLLVKSNEELHLNYFICSNHIEERYYVSKADPVIIHESAIPTLFGSNVQNRPSNVFNESVRAGDGENIELPCCNVNMESDEYHHIGVKFSNLCRICGEESLDNIEIFSGRGIELMLRDKIGLHTPVTPFAEDLLPQRICTDCYNKLEIAHALTVTCLRTDMRLRRCLNIGEVQYDNKYRAIIEECALELAEGIQTLRDKAEETAIGHELTAEINRLEAKDYGSFDDSGNEIQSQLNDFIVSYKSVNDRAGESIIEEMGNVRTGKGVDKINEIVCLNCKDTFETPDMFENHKFFCDSEEISVVQKQNICEYDNTYKESEEKQTGPFCFPRQTCDACHRNFESETLLEQHKLHDCESLVQNGCGASESLLSKEAEPVVNGYAQNTARTVVAAFEKKCGHCDAIYPTKKELLNHMTEHHERRFVFKCVVCNKRFDKWSSLDIHEATHRADKPYLCDLCGKSFKHSNNLRGHKRTHLDESKKKRHVCEICGNAFRSRFHLREHMNQHEGNKPYTCEQCGKAFHKRIQLRQHKLSHELNKHVCPVCNASFNRRGNMSTHLKRHNVGNGTYTCSVCSCRCASMSELKLHRKMHTEQDIINSVTKKRRDKPVWQCNICARVFSKRTVLLNHERVHRGERDNVVCELCDKKLASKSSLLYHKKSVHSTERPHMCQYCGESFVTGEARLIHERTHTGERPYVCNVCDNRYKCSSNLNQHAKIHTGLKPHKCAYCDKSFTRKGALNVHQRIHDGVKPFCCDACGRTFTQKNDMLKHAKTHDVKTIRCDKCDLSFARKKDAHRHASSHEHSNTVIEEYVEVTQQVESYAISIV